MIKNLYYCSNYLELYEEFQCPTFHMNAYCYRKQTNLIKSIKQITYGFICK